MAAPKKILVSLPQELLCEVDAYIVQKGISRSEFIRESMKQNLELLHTMETRDKMRRGYEEMAGINREWAELGLSHDTKILDAYEENLSECE